MHHDLRRNTRATVNIEYPRRQQSRICLEGHRARDRETELHVALCSSKPVYPKRVDRAATGGIGHRIEPTRNVLECQHNQLIGAEAGGRDGRDSTFIANSEAPIAQVLRENHLQVRVAAGQSLANGHPRRAYRRFKDDEEPKTTGPAVHRNRRAGSWLRELSTGCGDAEICNDRSRRHHRRALAESETGGGAQICGRHRSVAVGVHTSTGEQRTAGNRLSVGSVSIEEFRGDPIRLRAVDEPITVRIAGNGVDAKKSSITKCEYK
jgi:hypothetical protein